MEIKISLDSPAIQEKFDRGGVHEVVKLLNDIFGYGLGPDDIGRSTDSTLGEQLRMKGGEVYDENGNVAGTWEVRA